MALKLYGAPMSTNTARVLICLAEKCVEFQFVDVQIFSGGHKMPEFIAKNPFGKVPVLEDDDIMLCESRAITAYICEKFKDSGVDLLRHGNMKEAALVKMWAEVEAQQYNVAIEPVIYQLMVNPIRGLPVDQATVDANIEKLKIVLDIYEARLSSNKYLAGEYFSLADVHHFPYTFYLMKTPHASLINDRPNVKAWWEDITSRPSFVKVAEGMTVEEK